MAKLVQGYSFPDDATDAEISDFLRADSASAPAAPPRVAPPTHREAYNQVYRGMATDLLGTGVPMALTAGLGGLAGLAGKALTLSPIARTLGKEGARMVIGSDRMAAASRIGKAFTKSKPALKAVPRAEKIAGKIPPARTVPKPAPVKASPKPTPKPTPKPAASAPKKTWTPRKASTPELARRTTARAKAVGKKPAMGDASLGSELQASLQMEKLFAQHGLSQAERIAARNSMRRGVVPTFGLAALLGMDQGQESGSLLYDLLTQEAQTYGGNR